MVAVVVVVLVVVVVIVVGCLVVEVVVVGVMTIFGSNRRLEQRWLDRGLHFGNEGGSTM